ncbi:MAG: hypothetical protein P0Y53_09930 [Candidatus Pseudobacter hemicellulosilyticus]|uniref:Spore coat protein U domain-containing protein n=1 Tax=Candidatus Pseudobacter hemicellulosilyticus TaxID=3121375 RepID=A0AAJ6BHK1_9BACT|nr:MAG: hypothetical protein P0Y53_09930 [Pseudobacter sp.]
MNRIFGACAVVAIAGTASAFSPAYAPATALYARIGTVCTLLTNTPNAALFFTSVAGTQATITSSSATPAVYLIWENNVCNVPVTFI